MTIKTIGIDISKSKLDVAVLEEERYRMATFDNSREGYRKLANWLKKGRARGAHVCIEATGRYGEGVAHYLHQRRYPVSMVNPARVKAYGRSQLKRNKTDREDAKVIAHFCATQEPHLWTPPSPEVEELRALVRRMDMLKAERKRELTRKQSGIPSEVVLDGIDAHLAFIDAQLEDLAARIKDLIDQDPDLRRQRELLTSIPGLGDVLAAKFIAEIPDISRFSSARQLAAFLGLSPSHHHSGSSVHRRGRLTKMGNARLRAAFYMPSLCAKKHNPIIKALVERLKAKGKPDMLINGAAMRKMVHLAYGVLKNDQPFDPAYLTAKA